MVRRLPRWNSHSRARQHSDGGKISQVFGDDYDEARRAMAGWPFACAVGMGWAMTTYHVINGGRMNAGAVVVRDASGEIVFKVTQDGKVYSREPIIVGPIPDGE